MSARAYARARELCVELRDQPRLLQATWGLIAVSIVRAELLTTQGLTPRHAQAGEDSEELPLQDGGPRRARRDRAHARADDVCAETFPAGRARLYDPGQHRPARCRVRDGPRNVRPDLGHASDVAQGVRRARPSQMPTRRWAWPLQSVTRLHVTVTLAYAAMLSQFRRDVSEVDRLADAVDRARRPSHGFSYYLAWAEVLRGWSLAAQGGGESAVARCVAASRCCRRPPDSDCPTIARCWRRACGRIGRLDKGLEVCPKRSRHPQDRRAMVGSRASSDTRGTAAPGGAGHGEAEACFRAAIDVARRQRARSLELRATSALRDCGRATCAATLPRVSCSRKSPVGSPRASTWIRRMRNLTAAHALLEELALPTGPTRRRSPAAAPSHRAALVRPG